MSIQGRGHFCSKEKSPEAIKYLKIIVNVFFLDNPEGQAEITWKLVCLRHIQL